MITLDTNVVVYACDQRDPVKRVTAVGILQAAADAGALIGLQVIGETQNALVRRLRLDRRVGLEAARDLLTQFSSFGFGRVNVEAAIAESLAGRLSYWDALLVSAAGLAGCTVMLSEDMQDGFTFAGVRTVNPFAPDGSLSEAAKSDLGSLKP